MRAQPPTEPSYLTHPPSCAVFHQAAHQTVLVVDDDPQVTKMLGLLLRQHGFAVLLAISASDASALYQARSHQIDLLITDVAMPHGDGPTLAEQLQGHCPALKVLFISGVRPHPDSQDVCGSVFLAKPFPPQTFLRTIHQLLAPGPSSA